MRHSGRPCQIRRFFSGCFWILVGAAEGDVCVFVTRFFSMADFGGGGGIEELKADFEAARAGQLQLANIFQEATWRPLKRTSVIQKFNYYWDPEDSDQFNYVLTAAIRIRLTDLLGFEFSYNKSYDSDVGITNSKDDEQWRNALVLYF